MMPICGTISCCGLALFILADLDFSIPPHDEALPAAFTNPLIERDHIEKKRYETLFKEILNVISMSLNRVVLYFFARRNRLKSVDTPVKIRCQGQWSLMDPSWSRAARQCCPPAVPYGCCDCGVIYCIRLE
jgi:hypothetical protein